MAGGSPYRERVARGDKPRAVTLYPARWVLAVTLSVLFVAVIVGFTTTPRKVSLACEITDDGALRCVSSKRSIWGEGRPLRTFVPAPERDATPSLLALSSSQAALELQVEYGQDSSMWISARFGTGQRVRLTDEFAYGGTFQLTEFFEFRSRLLRGESAKLQFRSGFDNLVALLGLPFLAQLLWGMSARTRVTLDPRSATVRISARLRFWQKKVVREIPLHRVAGVAVERGNSPDAETIYYPTLVLSDGEVVRLGHAGTRASERAEHQVSLLRTLLDVAPK